MSLTLIESKGGSLFFSHYCLFFLSIVIVASLFCFVISPPLIIVSAFDCTLKKALSYKHYFIYNFFFIVFHTHYKQKSLNVKRSLYLIKIGSNQMTISSCNFLFRLYTCHAFYITLTWYHKCHK